MCGADICLIAVRVRLVVIGHKSSGWSHKNEIPTLYSNFYRRIPQHLGRNAVNSTFTMRMLTMLTVSSFFLFFCAQVVLEFT